MKCQTQNFSCCSGIIETPMTDYIRFEIDEMIFPSARKLKENPYKLQKESAMKIDNLINKN